MKTKKMYVLLGIAIFIGSILIQRNIAMDANPLLLANIEALTQGESGGSGVDSVWSVVDQHTVRYLEAWQCDMASGKDTRKYALMCTRSCEGGKGPIPCSPGTWQEGAGTEDRNCIHIKETR